MACQPWPRSARCYRAALLSSVAGWGRLFSTYIRREWVAGVGVWRCPLWVPSEASGTKRIIKGELLVRQAADSFALWVIVRPTSIWGPWFDGSVPYKRFLTLIAKNLYVHPGRPNPLNSFGHVGNMVHQIEQILEAPLERVNRKTHWLCDYPPLRLRDWADEIQRAGGARPIRTSPLPLLRVAAASGDATRMLGWQNPPLTRFRLNNMITEMVCETSELERIVGPLPFSEKQGVAITVDWLRNHNGLPKQG
jgi:GlcNAc-P-P-Und epimerase